jgi:hypothetical protein
MPEPNSILSKYERQSQVKILGQILTYVGKLHDTLGASGNTNPAYPN